jgi:hypothetical protein
MEPSISLCAKMTSWVSSKIEDRYPRFVRSLIQELKKGM